MRVRWAIITRSVNDFLKTHYTISEVKRMPSDELEILMMLASAANAKYEE